MKRWILLGLLGSLLACGGVDAAAKVYRGRHVIRHFHMGPEDWAPAAGCMYDSSNQECAAYSLQNDPVDGCPFSLEEEGDSCPFNQAEQRVRQPAVRRGNWYSQYVTPHAERCRRYHQRCPLYDDVDVEDEYDVQASWPGKNETTWMRELNR